MSSADNSFFGFPSDLLGYLRATALRIVGKPGATAGTALAGATSSGAPTTGSFEQGDVVVGLDGTLRVCTTAGTPGTWTQVGGGGGSSTLAGDTDVSISSPANGQALLYQSADSLWHNLDAVPHGPTRYEILCDPTGSVLVTGSGDPVFTLVPNP